MKSSALTSLTLLGLYCAMLLATAKHKHLLKERGLWRAWWAYGHTCACTQNCILLHAWSMLGCSIIVLAIIYAIAIFRHIPIKLSFGSSISSK